MDSTKGTFRRQYLDDGLASIAEMGTEIHHHPQYPFVSRQLQRKPSLRNLSSGPSPFVSSPRSPASGAFRSLFVAGRFYEESQQPHFLDSCFLCKKALGGNKDIFMYRGDTPFCSEECRQEQIDMEEAKEKSRNLSASMRAMRKKESSSPTKTPQNCNFHSSTVAAA